MGQFDFVSLGEVSEYEGHSGVELAHVVWHFHTIFPTLLLLHRYLTNELAVAIFERDEPGGQVSSHFSNIRTFDLDEISCNVNFGKTDG